MRNYLKENNFENIDFIYNNSYIFEDKIICGTRCWNSQDSKEDKKLIRRENLRLDLSLAGGVKNYGKKRKIIVCTHFPPFNSFNEIEYNYISTMKKYNVKKCIYGHIHENFGDAIEGEIKGIDFKLVSCDYLDFKLIKIY